MSKKELKINYEGLKKFLKSLTYGEFRKNDPKIIEEAETQDDIEFFKQDKTKIRLSQYVPYGSPFLVDSIGNDLSIVFLTRRKYKNPKGRLIRAKFDCTIIDDCDKLYGSCLNGYWVIPERFIIKKGE